MRTLMIWYVMKWLIKWGWPFHPNSPSLPAMPTDFLNTSDDSEDLHLPNWEEEPDDNGNKVRNITYTLTLNNSIGPRTSPSTEKQICYLMSKPGRIYHVDCECCNGGIPYADSFYMLLRYCLTRVTPTKCRIVVTGELKYRKHVMAMFRAAHLRREAERLEAIVLGSQTALPKKKLRERGSNFIPPSRILDALPDSCFARQTSTPPFSFKRLVLLLLFNAVLFYKLWSLETRELGAVEYLSVTPSWTGATSRLECGGCKTGSHFGHLVYCACQSSRVLCLSVILVISCTVPVSHLVYLCLSVISCTVPVSHLVYCACQSSRVLYLSVISCTLPVSQLVYCA
ncbi:Protein Aster-B, partial [Bulinus truncatus]